MLLAILIYQLMPLAATPRERHERAMVRADTPAYPCTDYDDTTRESDDYFASLRGQLIGKASANARQPAVSSPGQDGRP